MFRRTLRWIRSHRKLTLGLAVLLLAIALNAVAYRHAYTMTHFTAGGARTDKPEALSLWQKMNVLFTGVNIPRPICEETPEKFGLPFTTHRFGGDDGSALEGWHIPHSQAKGLVIMFHGYAGCKASLLPEARGLHDLGYATFLVDFRGSGGSRGDATTVGVFEAEDVVAACDYARSSWHGEPVVLYGHSMGSAAILRAIATAELRPTALVLECPFDRLLSTVANRFTAMGLPSFPGAQLLVFWGGVQNGFNGFRHNPVEYAERVHCPVLLLLGEMDVRVTREQGEAIFRSFQGVKQLESFQGTGHDSLLAARPEQWRRAVRSFLERYSHP
jgi:alpha-beta hydrolase superfamily lysophospholipase